MWNTFCTYFQYSQELLMHTDISSHWLQHIRPYLLPTCIFLGFCIFFYYSSKTYQIRQEQNRAYTRSTNDVVLVGCSGTRGHITNTSAEAVNITAYPTLGIWDTKRDWILTLEPNETLHLEKIPSHYHYVVTATRSGRQGLLLGDCKEPLVVE